MFQMGPGFDIQSLQGAGITFGWRIKTTRELRVSLGLGNGAGSEDGRIIFYDNDDVITNNEITDAETDNSGMSLQLHWMSEIAKKENLSLYYGFGPTFRFSRDNINGSITETNGDSDVLTDSRISDEIRTISYGMSGILGAEYKFSNQFSLFGEYHLAARVVNNEYRTEIRNTTKVGTEFIRDYNIYNNSSDDSSLGFDGARLGLIFRF